MFSRRSFAVCLGAAALFNVTPLWSAGPEAFLRGKQQELIDLLKQGDTAAIDAKLEIVFNTLLDYETLAKLSLDSQWEELGEEERKQFVALLRRLVQRAYKQNIKKTLDYEVTYKGEDKASKGYLVKTVAKNLKKPRQQAISIEYVMHKVNGDWRVFDIVTEGSSLVHNYKNQFRRVIKKHGFAGLMKRMRSKADSDGD